MVEKYNTGYISINILYDLVEVVLFNTLIAINITNNETN